MTDIDKQSVACKHLHNTLKIKLKQPIQRMTNLTGTFGYAGVHRDTRGYAWVHLGTQPANKTSPKPKKQPKTT